MEIEIIHSVPTKEVSCEEAGCSGCGWVHRKISGSKQTKVIFIG